MWPISTRVNRPENDDPSILDVIELGTEAAYGRGRQELNLLRRAFGDPRFSDELHPRIGSDAPEWNLNRPASQPNTLPLSQSAFAAVTGRVRSLIFKAVLRK
jgi:hypothetical protein